jgi:hypothetical protein
MIEKTVEKAAVSDTFVDVFYISKIVVLLHFLAVGVRQFWFQKYRQ